MSGGARPRSQAYSPRDASGQPRVRTACLLSLRVVSPPTPASMSGFHRSTTLTMTGTDLSRIPALHTYIVYIQYIHTLYMHSTIHKTPGIVDSRRYRESRAARCFDLSSRGTSPAVMPEGFAEFMCQGPEKRFNIHTHWFYGVSELAVCCLYM